ncbi:hypothetical protein EHJ16_10280 [Cronobacter dublinensis]|nr:hypothetical protein [Cronobacter dublinensis]
MYTAIGGCQRFAENIFSRPGKRKNETAQMPVKNYPAGKFSAGIYNHFINLKRMFCCARDISLTGNNCL